MSADPTENDAQGPAKEPEPVDSEVTPVGGTSKKLLELSEAGDQNTRAFRAPRELLELARRQRGLDFRPSQAPEDRPSAAPPVPVQSVRPERPAAAATAAGPKGVSHAVPPRVASTPAASSQEPAHSSQKLSSSVKTTGQRGVSQPASGAGEAAEKDSSEAASSQKRRVRPVSLSPSEFSEGEAAPPRPIAEPLGARERPTRKPGRAEESAESSGPSISYQPASSRSANSVEALQQKVDADAALGEDAAPPVARSRPARALSSEPSSASLVLPPVSLAELVRAASDRTAAPSVPAPSLRIPANDLDPPMPSSLSSDLISAKHRAYFWALVFVLFIIIGFALARWGVLDLMLPASR